MNININKKYMNDTEAASESIINNTCFSCTHYGNRKSLKKTNSIIIEDDIVSDNYIEKRNKD